MNQPDERTESSRYGSITVIRLSVVNFRSICKFYFFRIKVLVFGVGCR